jgi:glucose/arabinose dehydrogenase
VYVNGPHGAGELVFVVERRGIIKVIENGHKRRGSFLDITRQVSCCEGERGLFSVAFANWKRSRRFYVYYTGSGGDLMIDEFRRKRGPRLGVANGSRRNVLRINHGAYSNHNGGQLQFGPDGLLYIATGDGGGTGDPLENAQDKNSLLGKLLRINPLRKGRHGSGIPRSNPYVGKRGRDEILARGLRNPWRFSFDRRRIVIGDVGQDRREEIDFERLRNLRGANFGWNRFEGTLRYAPGSAPAHRKPVFQYPHTNGRCAITGGYVVRDRRLRSLDGRYVYGDLCTGEIRSIKAGPGGAGNDRSIGVERKPGLTSFGVDARNHVYVAQQSGGVYRIDPR